MLTPQKATYLLVAAVYMMFMFPSEAWSAFPLILVPGTASLYYVGLGLFLVGYFFSGPAIRGRGLTALRWIAGCLLFVMVFTDLMKIVGYSPSLRLIYYAMKPVASGYCLLAFVALGVRPGILVALPHVVLALGISALSFLCITFFNIPMLNPFVDLNFQVEDMLEKKGRAVWTMQFSSVLLLAFAYFLISRLRGISCNKVILLFLLSSSLLALLGVGVGFSRTYFAALAVTAIIMMLLKPSISGYAAITFSAVGLVSFVVLLLSTNQAVFEQFMERIEIIRYGTGELLESVYYGNREAIFYDLSQKLSRHPIMGTPFHEAFSIRARSTGISAAFGSDFAYLNSWTRFGVMGGVLHLLFIGVWLWTAVRYYFQVRRSSGIHLFYGMVAVTTMLIYPLVALNHDVFFEHAGMFTASMFLFGALALENGLERACPKTRLTILKNRPQGPV